MPANLTNARLTFNGKIEESAMVIGSTQVGFERCSRSVGSLLRSVMPLLLNDCERFPRVGGCHLACYASQISKANRS